MHFISFGSPSVLSTKLPAAAHRFLNQVTPSLQPSLLTIVPWLMEQAIPLQYGM